MKAKITKAIIPAAGFGTRMLPATRAVPKELLPLAGKPVIQHVVEEATAAGIQDILIILSEGKEIIQRHFSRDHLLEKRLKDRGKEALRVKMEQLDQMANLYFTWQHELNGLGDAITYGKSFTGDEPFAVLLGDTVMESDRPVIGQLMAAYNETEASVIALQSVDRQFVNKYGVIHPESLSGNLLKAIGWVEKPDPASAPSNLAIAARYILDPAIYDELVQTKPGHHDEIQLTDAIASLTQKKDVYGLIFEGQRHDLGNRAGFLKANLAYALRDPEMAEEFQALIRDLQ